MANQHSPSRMKIDVPHSTSIPPGWEYNPSSWTQRLWVAGLSVLGILLATYTSNFATSWADSFWRIFSSSGSEAANGWSALSLRPISTPHFAFGAASYLMTLAIALPGSEERWRKQPGLVLIYGLCVLPLGAFRIAWVVMQPLLFREWCAFCLASAFISILTIGPALDEVLATVQYLQRERRKGRIFWKVLLRGG